MNQEFPVLELDNFYFNDLTGICLLDHELRGNNQITIPHKHDFYLFFLIRESSGTHTIDFTGHKVADRQFHILLPEQVHHWDLSADTKGYQLMISKKVFQTFTGSLYFSPVLYFNHPVISLTDEAFHVFEQEFQQLDLEMKRDTLHWNIIHLRCKLIIELLARQLSEAFTDLEALKSNPVIVNYLNLADEFYKQEKTVAFYAGKLNITPNYLNILCKRHIKVSAIHVIQNRVILESKRLLQVSEMNIKEIAYTLGFDDLANFSNFFKSKTGLSPRDFRQKL